MNLIKPRFVLNNTYPFSKYKLGIPFYPTNKQIKEIEKFPYFFEDITVEYKILKKVQNNIIKVQNLRNGEIFQIGDKVYYKLDWIKEKLKFTITDFNIQYSYNHILIAHSKKGQMCGLTLLNHI